MTTAQQLQAAFTAPMDPAIARWTAFVAGLWLVGLALSVRGRQDLALGLCGAAGVGVALAAVPGLLGAIGASPVEQLLPTAASHTWVLDYALAAVWLAVLAAAETRRYGLSRAWLPAVVLLPGTAPFLLAALHRAEHVERRPPLPLPDLRIVTGPLLAASALLALRTAFPADSALAWETAYLDTAVTPLATYIAWTVGVLGPTVLLFGQPRLKSAAFALFVVGLTTLCVAAGMGCVFALYLHRHAPGAGAWARAAAEERTSSLPGAVGTFAAWVLLSVGFVGTFRMVASEDPAELCQRGRAERLAALPACASALQGHGEPVERLVADAGAGVARDDQAAVHAALQHLSTEPSLPARCREVVSADWRVHSMCSLGPVQEALAWP